MVQLRPRTDPPGEILVGRVEHIASGTVFRFRSAAELTAFLAGVDADEPTRVETIRDEAAVAEKDEVVR